MSGKRASAPTAEKTKEVIDHLETFSSTLEGFDFVQNALARIAEHLRVTIPVRPATV
jgi:hypothetical protein